MTEDRIIGIIAEELDKCSGWFERFPGCIVFDGNFDPRAIAKRIVEELATEQFDQITKRKEELYAEGKRKAEHMAEFWGKVTGGGTEWAKDIEITTRRV